MTEPKGMPGEEAIARVLESYGFRHKECARAVLALLPSEKRLDHSDGEGAGPSPLAAYQTTTPSASRRGEPSPDSEKRLEAGEIERVAEAINRARYPDDRTPLALSEECQSSQEYARRLARAAIRSLSPAAGEGGQ